MALLLLLPIWLFALFTNSNSHDWFSLHSFHSNVSFSVVTHTTCSMQWMQGDSQDWQNITPAVFFPFSLCRRRTLSHWQGTCHCTRALRDWPWSGHPINWWMAAVRKRSRRTAWTGGMYIMECLFEFRRQCPGAENVLKKGLSRQRIRYSRNFVCCRLVLIVVKIVHSDSSPELKFEQLLLPCLLPMITVISEYCALGVVR